MLKSKCTVLVHVRRPPDTTLTCKPRASSPLNAINGLRGGVAGDVPPCVTLCRNLRLVNHAPIQCIVYLIMLRCSIATHAALHHRPPLAAASPESRGRGEIAAPEKIDKCTGKFSSPLGIRRLRAEGPKDRCPGRRLKGRCPLWGDNRRLAAQPKRSRRPKTVPTVGLPFGGRLWYNAIWFLRLLQLLSRPAMRW